MSPLLFLLIVEGLSMLINKEKGEGKIAGLNISRILRITHILYVDDVVLFCQGTLE